MCRARRDGSDDETRSEQRGLIRATWRRRSRQTLRQATGPAAPAHERVIDDEETRSKWVSALGRLKVTEKPSSGRSAAGRSGGEIGSGWKIVAGAEFSPRPARRSGRAGARVPPNSAYPVERAHVMDESGGRPRTGQERSRAGGRGRARASAHGGGQFWER